MPEVTGRTVGWFDIFQEYLSTITGRRYHYRVQFSYTSRESHRLWATSATVSLTYRSRIGAMRAIKCAMFPGGIKHNPQFKNLPLNNGTLDVEPTCYLGWY